ncbi:MAG: hypothetical protein WBP12_02845 [Candidatus Saccharimonas sp.]
MRYTPGYKDVSGRSAEFWLIGTDTKPDRHMRRSLRNDLCEMSTINRSIVTPGLTLMALTIPMLIFTTALDGWAILVLLMGLVTIGVGIPAMLALKGAQLRERDRVRLREYLAINHARVVDLNAPIGDILVKHFALRNVAFATLTESESRLVDEYFTGINIVEADEILSAEGASKNVECLALRARLMDRAENVCEVIKSCRRSLATGNDQLQQVIQNDLNDRTADMQARLSYRARQVLETI